MKVMVLVKATKESEAGELPTERLLSEMGKYNEELVKAGIMLVGEGLQPSSKGARVRFSGKSRTVVDGPFTETKELIAGYWIWQVKSLAEAIEWVKRCPNPMLSDSDIDIRPIYTFEDFGDTWTPELQQRQEQMQVDIERFSLEPPRFEQGRELLVAGLKESYTFETRVKIPDQWQRFIPHFGSIPGQVGQTTYGVCWNYQPERGFDYLAGIEVGGGARLPQDFAQVHIPAGRYAVFAHRKHVSSIPETIEAIWTKWLPNSGHQAANTPAFERYGEDFNPETHIGGIEIWLPLKT
jgi:AraC family transcriptional regulator